MVGPVELLLTAGAAVVGGAAWTAGFVMLRRVASAEPVARTPIPWIPLILALLAILAALPSGLALGGPLVEGVVLVASAQGTALVVQGPVDALAAYPSGAALATVWFLLPGLLAAGSLLMSRDRSWRRSALLVAAGWLGFGLGLAVGVAVVVPMALGLLDPGLPGAMVSLVDLVASIVGGMAACGVVGACGPVAWVLAGSSRAALRTTALLTLLMPAVALLVAAVTTPPDPLTQLSVAAMIGTSWLLGLGAGAVTAMVRRPAR